MSTVLTDGFVLRKYARGDYDREYVVYTRDLGKISVIARGAQKTVSKLAGHLEPFLISQIMVARGVSFYRLAAATTRDQYSRIRTDASKAWLAGCFLEALDLLVKNDFPEPAVFDLAEYFFSRLEAADGLPQALLALNLAVFGLLGQLGYHQPIRAKSQKALLSELTEQVVAVAERPLKTTAFLAKIII